MAVTNITITPGAALTVLSLDNAKLQLRLESSYTDEDDLITAYIQSAVAVCENYINGKIQPNNVVIKMDGFQTKYAFESYPVSAVAVKYYKDGEASLTTLATTEWHTETIGTKTTLVIDTIPSDVDTDRNDAVQVECSLGYASAGDIPAPIVQAVKLQVTDMYERREDRVGIAVKASQNLLRAYRNYL